MASLCDICKLNKCKIKGKSFHHYNKNTTNELGAALWNQRQQGRFCDVILSCGTEEIQAHRCVLVVESGYFNGLLSGNFSDGNLTQYNLPEVSLECTEKVLKYMYTGHIDITVDEIEQIYILTDYLCINSLIAFCQEIMTDMITCQTCFLMLEISNKFHLVEVKEKVLDFMCPHAKELLQNYAKSLQLSPFTVKTLFHSNKINYISEKFFSDFIMQWAKNENLFDHARALFQEINPYYFSKEDLNSYLQNPDFISFLDEKTLEECQRRLTVEDENVILCRTRAKSQVDTIQLLSYSIERDMWDEVKLNETTDISGLETMVQHKDKLYFLTSTTEDLCGYMHTAKEIKSFFRLCLRSKQVHQFPSPNKASKQCHLVSHLNGLFVLDKCGVIEMFDEIGSEWFDVGAPIFKTVPLSTLYYMPMPMDRYIYIIRIYSLGYSTEYAEFAISLHLYDTISGTSRVLSNIESSELDLEPTERFYGYVIVPGKILLKNCVGQNRVEYDITSDIWHVLEIEKHVPECLGTIWGSVQTKGKCYIVCNYSSKRQHFLMYDCNRNRLKEMSLPNQQLTGLMICLPSNI